MVLSVARRRPPVHDRDAGGDEDVLAAKAVLRLEVWSTLQQAKVARFPGAEGRIPNFVGAEAAADNLRDTAAWKRSATVKANPDSPQLPVRQRALEDGKLVFMAAPRLAADKPFLALDPRVLTVAPRKAVSISGAARHGRPVDLTALRPVDLVVTGCVAVSQDGARLGKGGGFSDLEYALAWEAGLIGPSTVIVTTAHPVQILENGRIPVTGHDFRVEMIVTPEGVIRCQRRPPSKRQPAIAWGDLTEEKIQAIPLLDRLRP
jgi:5-formyltetrahydrofolate cyclo-ligase